jgi:hypothetical protein
MKDRRVDATIGTRQKVRRFRLERVAGGIDGFRCDPFGNNPGYLKSVVRLRIDHIGRNLAHDADYRFQRDYNLACARLAKPAVRFIARPRHSGDLFESQMEAAEVVHSVRMKGFRALDPIRGVDCDAINRVAVEWV